MFCAMAVPAWAMSRPRGWSKTSRGLLPQAYPCAPAIPWNEFDPGGLQGSADILKCARVRLAAPDLEISKRCNSHRCGLGQLLAGEPQHRASSQALLSSYR